MICIPRSPFGVGARYGNHGLAQKQRRCGSIPILAAAVGNHGVLQATVHTLGARLTRFSRFSQGNQVLIKEI